MSQTWLSGHPNQHWSYVVLAVNVSHVRSMSAANSSNSSWFFPSVYSALQEMKIEDKKPAQASELDNARLADVFAAPHHQKRPLGRKPNKEAQRNVP